MKRLLCVLLVLPMLLLSLSAAQAGDCLLYTSSPGTCFVMDYGYARDFPDLPFVSGAAVLTRVVSRPAPGLFTLDLGCKGIGLSLIHISTPSRTTFRSFACWARAPARTARPRASCWTSTWA